jgi:hypothetical protein
MGRHLFLSLKVNDAHIRTIVQCSLLFILESFIEKRASDESRALNLHGEEITSESLSGNEEENKVVFFAFTGVAPRQYRRLFSMSERGAKKSNSLQKWQLQRRSLSPLHVQQNASLLYLSAECHELEKLALDVYRWDKKNVCPGGVTLLPTISWG